MRIPPLRRAPGSGDGSPEPVPPRWMEGTVVAIPEMATPGAEGGTPAPDGFLGVLRIALAAARVSVWRRDGEAWEVEREARDRRADPGRVRPLAAAGHPFTWALKEGLQLQVLSEELFGTGGGWSLVGGPAGPGRVLCVSFEGTPGPTARPALGPALRHLRALHRAEAGGGSAGRPPAGPAV